MKNVFEVLGLKADHRATATKVCQLPRHLDEITVAASKKGPFFVDTKYDGNHAVIPVKDSKILGVFSRVGKPFTNMEGVLDCIDRKAMKDGVYFAELYCPREVMPMQKFQALHGTNRTNPLTEAQRQVIEGESRLAFFDHITLEAFIGDSTGVATDSRPLSERREKLEKLLKKFSQSSRVHHAKYVKCETEEEARELAKKRIKDGEEGVVGKGAAHPYVCGHKNFHFWKIVKQVRMDLTCRGFYEGEGKRAGTLGGLLFTYGEGEVRADLGKDYGDKERAELYRACVKGKKDSPVGKIFEIYALERLGLTNLRQAKVGKVREDKLIDDNKKEDKVKKSDKKADKTTGAEATKELSKKGPKAAAKAAEKTAEKAGKEEKATASDKKGKKDKTGKSDVSDKKAKDKEPPFTPDEPVADKGKKKEGKKEKAAPEKGKDSKKDKKKKTK